MSLPIKNVSLEELDKRAFFHPYTALAEHAEGGPRVIAKAEGIRVTDTNGEELIDGFAGLWCSNIGYSREEMAEAIYEQARTLSYFHCFGSMGTEPSIRLADLLIDLMPDNMSKVQFGNSGSDANDTSIKVVWLYNNILGRHHKKKIIARHRGYHGITTQVAAVSSLPTVHSAFDLPIERVRRVSPACYYWRPDKAMTEADYTAYLVNELEQVILNEGPDTVAAFIAEPIAGAGGLFTPPDGYWEGVQRVLAKYDVLLILDEVVTGFGRVGHMFAAEAYAIVPDIMTMAKGLTSGYVPMSASVFSEDIWQVLLEGHKTLGVFGHGYTYSAHPLAAAAGLANIEIMLREKLVDNAAVVGRYLQKRLRDELNDHPLVGDIRGIGLLAGIELADKSGGEPKPFEPRGVEGQKLAVACRNNGLIGRLLMDSDVFALSPPLIISNDEVDLIISILKKSLDEVLHDR